MNELIRKVNRNARPKERTANKAAKERGRMKTEKSKFVAKTEMQSPVDRGSSCKATKVLNGW